jgi:hypothetical protein
MPNVHKSGISLDDDGPKGPSYLLEETPSIGVCELESMPKATVERAISFIWYVQSSLSPFPPTYLRTMGVFPHFKCTLGLFIWGTKLALDCLCFLTYSDESRRVYVSL